MNNWHLLLKRKDIALIWKIREDQNLWVIWFMQLIVMSDTFSAFFIISLLQNKCQYLFFTRKLKVFVAPREIEHTFHTQDHGGPPLHILTHWPPNKYGIERPGWKAPVCALNSFNSRCVWCVGGRTAQYGGEGHMGWGPPTAQGTSAWERTCIRHCQPP